MNNELGVLDDILYKELVPWLDEESLDEKYASELDDLSFVEMEATCLYQLDFIRPFNLKTEYYQKLIINGSNAYCNKIRDLLEEDDDLRLQKYWCDNTQKKLKGRLKDVGVIIKERLLDIEYINPRKTNFSVDTAYKVDVYVFQLLKLTFIKIYLETQHLFKHLSNTTNYNEDDLYMRFLGEPIPDISYLKSTQPVLELHSVDPQPLEISKAQNLVYPSFRYKKYATNWENLTDLCDSLKRSRFIDQKTDSGHFKRIFSGKEINNPIVWTGNPSEFAYFIKLIYTEHQLLEDLKQKQWKVACKCFLKSDRSQFYAAKIRKLQRPVSTGDMLEKSVRLLF